MPKEKNETENWQPTRSAIVTIRRKTESQNPGTQGYTGKEIFDNCSGDRSSLSPTVKPATKMSQPWVPGNSEPT